MSIDGIYPIGMAIFFAQNKDPNKLFPGTKWQYTGENKTIRLAKADGSDILKTGGADTLKLTAAQLPAHGHTFSATTSSFDYGTKTTNNAGAHVHKISGISVPIGTGENCLGAVPGQNKFQPTESGGEHVHTVAIGAHVHTVSGTTANIGSGNEINITNAFVTLMCWYRVS
ncbi:phage tail protein (plasmid) [Arsenophonus sp. aPb]|uniref:phage baseplate protein n=1 Tax=Arsenophonus sp. aPb TaxID=3041619 RepID=UPI0024688A7C|nr:phage tail protein [Arsenophonus sp. aPb]WGL99952.1 phage tail protein [Arsenophonus sp. aPb]